MEKLKKWLEPTNNKIIASVIAVVLIGAIGTGIYLATKKDVPVVIFNENIVVEYGQKSFADEEASDSEDKKESLPILDPESIVNKDKSKYDEISFNKIASSKEPMTLEFRFIDTSEIGENEGILYARLGDEVKEFKFEYEVKDTHSPIIENVSDQEITEGEAFNHEFKSHDIIDGELDVIIEGEYDINVPGTYDLKVVSEDKNKNKTEVEFKLTILEKEIAVVENVETTLPGTGSNKGTSINTNGSKPNGNSNSNSINNNSSNNNGSTTKPVNPTKPTEPTNPVKPVEPTKPVSEWKEYKDYGSFESCRAVIDDVHVQHIKQWKQSMCDDGVLRYKNK